MVKHVVFWRVKDEFEGLKKEQIIQKMKNMLEALPEKIDEIKEFEVGVNVVHSERAYDVCLISMFESLDALKLYAGHPDHLVVVDYFKNVVTQAAAVDFNC